MTLPELLAQGYTRARTHHGTEAASLFAVSDSTVLYLYDMDDTGASPFGIASYYEPDAAQALAVTHGFNADWTPVGAPEAQR